MTIIPPALRSDLRPGDLGAMTAAHGRLYAAEHGFDSRFEAYVAQGLGRLALDGGAVWLAQDGDRLAGMMAMVEPEPARAQLRYLLVVPEARGSGLGTRLIQAGLAWARERGAHTAFLWTVAGLQDAARLYRRFGFRLAETRPPAMPWGPAVEEQRYELSL